MKILHVTKKYPNALGGDAVVVSNLEKQQKKNGHKVTILTSNCDEIKNGDSIYKFGLKDTPESLDGITIKRLLSLSLLFFKAFKVLRKERPDVIHTHSIDMAFFISFAARLYNIPIIHTFHIVTYYDENQSSLRRKTELLFARGAKPAVVTAPNAFDTQKLRDAGLIAEELPNGVDLNFWKPNSPAKKNDIFTFVSVGRLEDQKGNEYLIRAAATLRREWNRPFKVLIIGTGSLGPSLKDLTVSLGVDDYIEFVGRKSPKEVRDIYSSADVAVFPALYETTPLTLLEAWAMQLPTISTPVGILKASEYSHVTLLVKIRDEMSLAKAMGQLISQRSTRSALAKAGNTEVKQYSWNQVFKTAENVYKGLTDKNVPEQSPAEGEKLRTILVIPDNPQLRGRRYFMAECLATRGHDVHYIMWDNPFNMHGKDLLKHFFTSLVVKEYRQDDITVHKVARLPYYWPYVNGLLFRIQLRRLYKRVGASLIFTETYTNETEVPQDLPFIYDLSDDYAAPGEIYGSPAYRLAFKLLGVKNVMRRQCHNAIAVTAVSENLCKYARQHNSMVFKLPNAVDVEAIREVLDDKSIKAENKYSLVYLSGFGKWSRPIETIQAVYELRKEFAALTLTMIGPGTEAENIRRYIEKLNAHDFIFYLGPIFDRKTRFEHVKRSAVGLNISTKDKFRDAAFPVKVIEYSALGKKVVSTNLTEVKTLKLPNVFIFKYSPSSLKSTIRQALHHSGMAKEYSLISKRVLEEYSWDKATDGLLEITNAAEKRPCERGTAR